MKHFLIAALLAAMTTGCIAGDTPAVGETAPDFRLQDQNGEWRALEDYRGEWLAIYFYPKDDTPGCTTEACNFRDNIYAFKAVGANVVGISVDDVDSHKEFATKYQLPFTLLADEGGKVCDAYGVLKNYGVAKLASRQSFLVNPDGVIVKHYAKVDPDEHTQEVLKDIETFKAGDA